MLLLFVLLLFLLDTTLACGGFFCTPNQPVVQSGESIIFGVDDSRTVSMHVLINYQGPSEGFSWLLPIMHEPVLNTSSDLLFVRTFDLFRPRFQWNMNGSISEGKECWNVEDSIVCNVAEDDGAFGGGVAKGIIEKKGTTGPFDYAIIQSPNRNLTAVTGWLSDNGYDQYAGSDAILDHYVQTDHYFVALKLSKNSNAGDITPISLSYTLPDDNADAAFACVPLILTGVASVDALPINVYILGKSAAEPVNYFRVELDDRQVDWLGCRFSETCFDADYRARAQSALTVVDDHAFIVEYAGRNLLLDEPQVQDLNVDALAALETPLEFLEALNNVNIPAFRFLDNIINEYIPLDESMVPNCPSAYVPPFQFRSCLQGYLGQQFDAAGLAAALDEKVFQPAAVAQQYVNQFSTATALYVQMRQEKMSKDPFFRFQLDSEDELVVDNVHTATADPFCVGTDKALQVTLSHGESFTMNARIEPCVGWISLVTGPLYNTSNNSPAHKVVLPGYGNETAQIVDRSSETGTFDEATIEELVTQLDGRVMDQTVPPLPPTIAPPPPPPLSPEPPSPAGTGSGSSPVVPTSLCCFLAILVSVAF